MDKKYIDENEIEIKYLRNQLTADELEEFEVYLMENPESLEELDIQQLVYDSLSEAKAVRQSDKGTKTSWLYIKRLFEPMINIGLAFCLGAVSVTFLSADRLGPDVGVAYELSLDETLRGLNSPDPQVINLDSSLFNFISLRVNTGDISQVDYQVLLESNQKSGTKKVEFFNEIATNTTGDLLVIVTIERLVTAHYTFVVSTGDGVEKIRREFELVIKN